MSHDSSSDFAKDEHTEEAGECSGDIEEYELGESGAEVTVELRLDVDEYEDEEGKQRRFARELLPTTSEFVITCPDSASHMYCSVF